MSRVTLDDKGSPVIEESLMEEIFNATNVLAKTSQNFPNGIKNIPKRVEGYNRGIELWEQGSTAKGCTCLRVEFMEDENSGKSFIAKHNRHLENSDLSLEQRYEACINDFLSQCASDE